MIKAYWFNNQQTEAEILQPDFFTPKTLLRLDAELPCIEFPIKINVSASYQNLAVFNKSYVIKRLEATRGFAFEVRANGKAMMLKDIVDTLENSPDQIDVEIQSGNITLSQTIACEYATISGNITDFNGNPFSAAVVCHLERGESGVWSDMAGNYSITLPKGEYNSIFVDDESYGKTSLEAWGWKMIVDKDEVHDFKIGNGEVYSLDVWANNGGYRSLFVAFRPMALSYCLQQATHGVAVNSKNYTVVEVCPDLNISDISVEINGCKATNISLQKILETGQDGTAIPMYILQIERIADVGKQTLILEYDFVDASGETIQSQGRTQFYYSNLLGWSVR
ncbi:MAG: carboxypeptidase-like regulatory domain-containing protein [Oscillospiraceae bacterium]|nr:carboxypeptidase-like regulatory domain-containing protein [Oscillospiraceae bacterium]